MQATIDLDMLDKGEENPFDKLMSAYERVKLQTEIGFLANDFEKKILYLERKLQDLSEKQDEISSKILIRSKEILSAYSTVLISDFSLPSFELIEKSLDSISSLIDHSWIKSANELNIEFDNLSPSKYLRNLNILNPTVDELKQAAYSSMYYSHNNIFFSELNLLDDNTKKMTIDSWDVDFSFSTSGLDKHKPLDFIYIFIEILNKIEGVEIFLEDIKIGSIKARVKINFKTQAGKESLKNVLNESIGSIKADLNDASKKNLETIELTKLIPNEIVNEQLSPTDILQNSYLISLQIKNAEEDLLRKKLENERLKIQILRESIETNSGLLANAYLSHKDYEILIKGISFLKVVDGQFQVGESAHIIDDL